MIKLGDVVWLPSDAGVMMTVIALEEPDHVTVAWFDSDDHFQHMRLPSSALRVRPDATKEGT